MQEHDLHRGALLIVVWSHDRLVDAEREDDRGQAAEPRNRAVGKGKEARRVGEIGDGHRQVPNQTFCLSMIFSENRPPLFGIML